MAPAMSNHVVEMELSNGLGIILKEDHSAPRRLHLDLVSRRQSKRTTGKDRSSRTGSSTCNSREPHASRRGRFFATSPGCGERSTP